MSVSFHAQHLQLTVYYCCILVFLSSAEEACVMPEHINICVSQKLIFTASARQYLGT